MPLNQMHRTFCNSFCSEVKASFFALGTSDSTPHRAPPLPPHTATTT